MNLIHELLKDESGLILSAEAVTVGTIGVLGAVVGLTAAGNSVNGELKEMAGAIRSLDQSYGFAGHRSKCAWTAGSYYVQPDVQQSLAELSADSAPDVKGIQQRIDAERKSHSEPTGLLPSQADPTPTPLPNQIPVPEVKKADEAK